MDSEDMASVKSSPAENVAAIASDSDDDEPLFISRKKKHFSILDDSDEDDETSHEPVESSSNNELKIGIKPVIASDDSDDEEHENHNLLTRNSRVESSDNDKSDNDEDNDITADGQSMEQMTMNCVDTDDEVVIPDTESRQHEPLQVDSTPSQQKRSRIFASDIFDAETDSDDERTVDKDGDKDSSDSEEDNDAKAAQDSNPSEDDSDEDMPEMSAALKKRLKKGAGKKIKGERSDRAAKPRKEDIQEIHSETQRIVRESSIRLPYHKPEKIELSVFLARTQQKQQQLQTSKQGFAWKQTPLIKPEDKRKLISSVTSSKPKAEKVVLDESSTDVSDKHTVISDKPSIDDAVCAMDTISASLDKVRKDISKDLNDAEEEDWDNLPDLFMEKESTKVQYEIVTSEELNELDTNNTKDKLASKQVQSELHVDSIEDKTCKPEESGYFSIPTSEEENSGDHSKNDDPKLASIKCADEKTEHSVVVPCNATIADIPNIADLSAVDNVALKSKSFLTPKLANLSLDKLMPKLSGTPDSFIDFDDEDEMKVTPKVPAGIEKLFERVIKHSAKRSNKQKDIEINLISKEQVSDDREELQLKKLTYHVDEEEMASSEKPGAKLTHLKQKLQEQMRLKREQARLKRQEAYTLDNEEGYEDVDDEDAALDDENEMTDQSDTESEEEEEMDEEELLAAEEDEEDEAEKENNPFMDNEAAEDDGDEEDEDDLHLKLDMMDDDSPSNSQPLAQSSAQKDFLQSALKKSKTIDLFDEDANTESPTMSQHSNKECPPEISSRPFQQLSGDSSNKITDDPLSQHDDDILLLETQSAKSDTTSTTLTRDISMMSTDSSFEGTLIPAGQKSRRNISHDRYTPDLFTPSSKSSIATINKSISHVSDIIMPVEDSQDLLAQSPSRHSLLHGQSAPLNFHFQLEETQSQLLDDEGLFKVMSDKKPARRQLMLDSTMGSNSQNTEDELLGLCSGKFTEDSRASGSKSLFSADSQISTQNNMDELLDLCSGRFTEINQGISQYKPGTSHGTQSSRNKLEPGTGPFTINTEENSNSPVKILNKVRQRHRVIEDDSNDSFVVTSGGEEEPNDNDENLSSDEDEEEPVDEDADSDDEEMQQARMFKGFGKKHGKIRSEFVEEEAELSGSEYDSDENLDIAAKDDILELEAGDLDDVGTEEDLRNQVSKVHLKSVIDADNRELKLFQEMYLQDGDLHSDGAGRQRKFRWRNIDDDDTQQDLFQSDDEADKEEGMDEQQWRVKRFEREKFIQEQKEKEDNQENDERITLGKVIFRPNKCSKPDKNSSAIEKQKSLELPQTATALSAAKENFTKPKIPSHGSFLRRNKVTLAKIVELSKPASNLGGARQSGNFVFTALSPGQKELQEKRKPHQVKRSISSQHPQSQNKRQKLERSNSIPENSIFRLM